MAAKATQFAPFQISMWLALAACGSGPPDDVQSYETACLRMNREPLAPYDGDPHKGWKNVYVCNLSQELASGPRPFPDGTLIVKDSRRPGEDFTWLLATARKANGRWQWDEYTRNFNNEEHRRLAVPESTCIDCHQQAESSDYIFTRYQLP